MQKKVNMKLLAAAILSATVLQSQAFAGNLSDPVVENPVLKPYSVRDTVIDDIEARSDEYEEIIRSAKRRGAFLGFAQGAAIGALVTGEPSGGLVGGLLGSTLGRYAANKTALSLVTEHQNYIIKKRSLSLLLEAARYDREQTSFDLDLSLAFSEREVSTENLSRDISKELSEFYNVALERYVALYETSIAIGWNDAGEQLLAEELKRQKELISEFSNLIGDQK